MRKQFPEIASTTMTAAETEPKALELFCTQQFIIAFSLIRHRVTGLGLAYIWCKKNVENTSDHKA
jgi:hypothetical protein